MRLIIEARLEGEQTSATASEHFNPADAGPVYGEKHCVADDVRFDDRPMPP